MQYSIINSNIINVVQLIKSIDFEHHCKLRFGDSIVLYSKCDFLDMGRVDAQRLELNGNDVEIYANMFADGLQGEKEKCLEKVQFSSNHSFERVGNAGKVSLLSRIMGMLF